MWRLRGGGRGGRKIPFQKAGHFLGMDTEPLLILCGEQDELGRVGRRWVTGNWQLATGNWQLATFNLQLTTFNWQLTIVVFFDDEVSIGPACAKGTERGPSRACSLLTVFRDNRLIPRGQFPLDIERGIGKVDFRVPGFRVQRRNQLFVLHL